MNKETSSQRISLLSAYMRTEKSSTIALSMPPGRLRTDPKESEQKNESSGSRQPEPPKSLNDSESERQQIPDNHDLASSPLSDDYNYDMDTWKMYHRIQSSRGSCYNDDLLRFIHETTHAIRNDFETSASQHFISIMEDLQLDTQEIFELEL